jgi:hypothetical protein
VNSRRKKQDVGLHSDLMMKKLGAGTEPICVKTTILKLHHHYCSLQCGGGVDSIDDPEPPPSKLTNSSDERNKQAFRTTPVAALESELGLPLVDIQLKYKEQLYVESLLTMSNGHPIP